MAFRIIFLDPNASDEYRRAIDDTITAVARASSFATRDTARVIRQRGQENIAKSGQFGARWIEGLSVVAEPSSGFQIENSITIGHDQKGALLFEFGGNVQGKPLLWIPLSFSDAKGKRAASYPGGLFRVDRKSGKPLLLSISDRKPKFVGVSSVKVPRKWQLRDIAADAMANDFPKFYSERFKV